MSESESILNSVGVSVRDMGGNIREVGDILNDLSGRWTSLTSEQQQNIGVTVAGRYQLSRFLALMNNYQMALDATETAQHAQGSATRENAKYMESLQARIEKMKVSWQSLAVSMGENGMTDLLKGLIAIATSLGGAIEGIVQRFGAIPPILFVIGAAVTLFSTKLKTLVVDITKTSLSMVGLGTSAKAAKVGMEGAATGAKTFKTALRGLLASTGVGLAIAGLGIVLEKIIGYFGEASDSANDFSGSMEDIGNKVQDISYIEELGRRYEILAKKQKLTTEESIELANIQETLESRYSISTNAIQGNTESVKENVEAINQKVAAMQDEIDTQNRLAEMEFYKDESKKNKEIDTQKKEKDRIYKELEEKRKEYAQFQKELSEGRVSNAGRTNISGLYNDYLTNENELMAKGIQKIKESLIGELYKLEKAYGEASNKLEGSINEKTQAVQSKFNRYVSSLETAGTDISAAAKVIIDALAKIDGKNNLEITEEQFKNFVTTIEAIDTSNLEEVAEAIKNIVPEGVDVGQFLNEVKIRLTNLNFKGVADDIEGFGEAIETAEERSRRLKGEIKDLVGQTKTLNSTIHELEKGEKLSADAMYDLIDAYPYLINYSKQTADGWTIEVDVLKDLRDTHVDTLQQRMLEEAGFTETVLKQLDARLEAYGYELEAIQSLNDAVNVNRQIAQDKFMINEMTRTKDNPSGVDVDSEFFGRDGISSQLRNYGRVQEKFKAIQAMVKNIGVPSGGSSSKGSSSTSSNGKTPAEKAAEEAQRKYQEDVARFKYLAEMQNWSTQEQIDGWTRIENRHKSYLATSIEDQRSLNLELKKLREQRFNDDMSELNKRVEKMRINNATEVQMEQEKLRTYEKIAKKTDLTAEQRLELSSKIYNTKENISKGRLQETNDYLSKRNKIVEEYNRLLNVSEKRQALLNEESEEYNQETIIQNDLRHKMISFYQDEIAWIKSRLAVGGLEEDQIKALVEQQRKYEEAILDTSKAQRDTASDIADKVIDKITKAYEKAKEAAIDFIEKQMDKEDERHNQAIENIEKEQNAFNEAINNQIQALRRRKDEESYDKQLKKKQEEQAEIQAKINELMLDDSAAAKKKREELEQQLNDKIEEINEFQNDRQYELREQALNDAKDLNDKRVDSAKETENAIYKINKDALEQRKKDEEAYWKSILDNDEYFTALREDIISGNLENLSGYFGIFRTEVENHLKGVGEAINKNVIEKINKAQNLLGGLGYTSIFTPTTNGTQSNTNTFVDPFGAGMSRSDFERYLHNKYLYEVVGDRGDSIKENAEIRKKYGITVDKYSYEALRNMAQAKDGGLTPSWGSQGKLMMVHENELILNKADTSVLLKLFDFTKGLFNNSGSKFTTPAIATGSNSSTGDTYLLEMNIGEITGDKEGVDYFFSEVRKGLKKLGK